MNHSMLIKNIRWLVTCNDCEEVLENVSMLVQDGVIASIGKLDDVQADEVMDASGMILYPGLVNTHHHLYQTFSRNLPAVQRMELFPWLKYLYEIWKNLDEDSVYYSSLTGIGELLKQDVLPALIITMYFRKEGATGSLICSLLRPMPWVSVFTPPAAAWI